MVEQRKDHRFIRWDLTKWLLQGHDVAALANVLDDLEKSPGWEYVMQVIARYTEETRKRVFQSIDSDDQLQKMAHHNRNVYTVKALESVLELVSVARDRCVEEIRKAEGG